MIERAPTQVHPEPRSAGRSERRITLRSIVIGALLTPLNAFWIVRQERVMFGPYPSTISLFANVVFVLFLLVGVNALLRRVAPRVAFSQGELLTIYTMLAISTGLAGLDGVGILNQMIPHGAWFGAAQGWDKFLDAFPTWLVVRDRTILRGHFIGADTFYRLSTLRAWAPPILAWTGFVFLLMFVAQCLNVLVRRQWADRERLTFPIIWLPVEMTEGGSGTAFFHNPLMWTGFAIAAGISLWNGLAVFYPSLPAINVGITDMKPFITMKPWNAVDWLPITFYPLAIGLGYLIPLDLSFSCWFFFLFWRGQEVASNAMGWDATPDFPFIKEQGFGSLLALFAFYLWSGRRHYAEIVRQAFRRARIPGRRRPPPGDAPDADTASESAALFGALAGMAGLLLFTRAAGVTWWVSLAFFAIFIPTLLVITRIRAELGAPIHDFHFMGPDSMLPRALGASSFHPTDLAFFTFAFSLTRAHRSDTMPVGLEGLQMARTRHLEAGRMFAAILIATLVGTASAFWAFEHQAYALGAGARFNQGFGHAQQAFTRMDSWVSGTLDRHPNGPGIYAMVIGFLTTMALLFCRVRYLGFPFHPIGYAISSSWSIHLIWLPLLIAWTLKLITMRYGGLPAYRRFLPLFLGLMLGDCVMGSIWALLSLVLNTQTYNFFGA